MHTQHTRFVLVALALGGCLPGGKMDRPKELEGLSPVPVTETKAADGLHVTAGDFSITLPSDFAPFRLGNQVAYTRPAQGETVKIAAMKSKLPMDAAAQQAVLGAQGNLLSGVEGLMARFGGGKVSPPRIRSDAFGIHGTIDVTGPMTRRAIHTIVVTGAMAVTITLELSQPGADLDADAETILKTLRFAPAAPSPAPAAPAPQK